jgi:putative radical SAM enzyme (TIGR03279 family)
MSSKKAGGLVAAVSPGSLASRMGVRPGDLLLLVNGQPVEDVIDVRFHAAEDTVHLQWERHGKIREGECRHTTRSVLGLEFACPTFDTDIRRCNNRCPFCFVVQMAPGMRRTLHVKDDDYRYSFLYGHFVTLTNLTDRDWRRIAAQHLSPLYVSVHATEPDVRVRYLGNPKAGDILERLRFLAENRIEVHTQVVLAPGWNDGMHLERTLRDLAALYPAVRSCSVVPVGVTRFQRNGIRPYGWAEMEEVIRTVEGWQEDWLRRIGSRFAFLTDEWYLATLRPVPPLAAYEEIDLRENGLGMVRFFLEDWHRLADRLRRGRGILGRTNATLLTGKLFEGILREAAAEFTALTGANLRVAAVPNRRLGETVTVAGLLMAQDVIHALKECGGTGPVLIPRVIFGHPQALALDDLSPLDVSRAIGREVMLADTMSDVWDSLGGRNPLRAGPRMKRLPKKFYQAEGWEDYSPR